MGCPEGLVFQAAAACFSAEHLLFGPGHFPLQKAEGIQRVFDGAAFVLQIGGLGHGLQSIQDCRLRIHDALFQLVHVHLNQRVSHRALPRGILEIGFLVVLGGESS